MFITKSVYDINYNCNDIPTNKQTTYVYEREREQNKTTVGII